MEHAQTHTDDAVPAQRRAFTKVELQRIFDHIDDLVDCEYAAGTKRWLPSTVSRSAW